MGKKELLIIVIATFITLVAWVFFCIITQIREQDVSEHKIAAKYLLNLGNRRFLSGDYWMASMCFAASSGIYRKLGDNKQAERTRKLAISSKTKYLESLTVQ